MCVCVSVERGPASAGLHGHGRFNRQEKSVSSETIPRPNKAEKNNREEAPLLPVFHLGTVGLGRRCVPEDAGVAPGAIAAQEPVAHAFAAAGNTRSSFFVDRLGLDVEPRGLLLGKKDGAGLLPQMLRQLL